MAREEAIEAEKRQHFHLELIRKSQALNLKFKLEEEQAKLKCFFLSFATIDVTNYNMLRLESLQFSLQHGEFRPIVTPNKATIIVEVAPRELPEARQFDTSQVEPGIASAVLQEEGIATITDTRSIEEIVLEERKQKSTAYMSGGGVGGTHVRNENA